jgi:murein DD-endopeptidase MepM/ murein hydrolase activator NlpD
VYYGAYRDHGNQDYQCEFKWYSGHGGVDILLRNFEVQDSGVGVLAAAPGTVLIARDGLFDRSTQNGNGGFGNYVTIEHAEGELSSYGHMRNGSIRVAQNTVVNRGDTLGMVGSSGNSNWPHLHFEVQSNSQGVDPFLGPCNPPAGQPTWMSQLQWQGDFSVTDVGISNKTLSFPELLERPEDVPTITPADPMVTFWVNLHNIQASATRIVMYDPVSAIVSQVSTGTVTTYSVRFLTTSFGIQGVLQTAGMHSIAFFVTPFGSGEREFARRTFVYDPAVVPGPAGPALRGAGTFPRVWMGPEGGEARDRPR